MSIIRISGSLLWSTGLWVLLWGDVSIANVASGLAVGVIVNDGGRATDGERGRQHGVCGQVQHGFNFGGELVTEVDEPAAVKRQFRHRSAAVLGPPPGVECGEKPRRVRRVGAGQPPAAREFQRLAGKSEKDVETP